MTVMTFYWKGSITAFNAPANAFKWVVIGSVCEAIDDVNNDCVDKYIVITFMCMIFYVCIYKF